MPGSFDINSFFGGGTPPGQGGASQTGIVPQPASGGGIAPNLGPSHTFLGSIPVVNPFNLQGGTSMQPLEAGISGLLGQKIDPGTLFRQQNDAITSTMRNSGRQLRHNALNQQMNPAVVLDQALQSSFEAARLRADAARNAEIAAKTQNANIHSNVLDAVGGGMALQSQERAQNADRLQGFIDFIMNSMNLSGG